MTITETQGFQFDRSDFVLGGVEATSFVSQALSGALYFNTHTNAFASGETRGQLSVLSSDLDGDGNGTIILTADLSGDQEVPPTTSLATGTGTATLTVSDSGVAIAVTLDVSGMGLAELIGLHIHQGAVGV
ncbi:MAG: CHRD domain-containing protein, partial [Pseudoruegeria sp.]